MKRGDVVRFKSGGLPMTVAETWDAPGCLGQVKLQWLAQDGTPQEFTTHEDCLESALAVHPFRGPGPAL